MKKRIEIAAARRKIKRMEDDWPLFLARIAQYTPEEKQVATKAFETALAELRSVLAKLLGKNSN
jgi:hypothetical protein